MTEEELTEAGDAIGTWVQHLDDGGMEGILSLVLRGALTFALCYLAKRLLCLSLQKILERAKMEIGMQRFLLAGVNGLLWLSLLLIVAASVGIAITPLLAAFSVVGLALSLAIQGSLSNLAGGINILGSKPFVVGDFVEVDGQSGNVETVGMINTTLITVDKRRVIVPNSLVSASRIVNYSAEPERRVDVNFTASYDAPIAAVQEAVLALALKDPRVLPEPAAEVVVKDYGDSAIAYSLRVFCTQEDFWALYYDLMQKLLPALTEAGIEMTYPHVNVHIKQS